MRHSGYLHAFAGLSLLVGLAVFAPSSVFPDAHAKSSEVSERSVWLVEFEEPPLATFRGGKLRARSDLADLKATSPAVTGAARLDVDSPASVRYREVLQQLRSARLERAEQALGRALSPLFVYEVTNNGMAVELNQTEAEQLAGQDGIVSVTPDFVRAPQTEAGPRWIKADALWASSGGNLRGEGLIVGVIDTGINAKHVSFAQNNQGRAIHNPRDGYLGLCKTNATAGCNNKLIGIYDHTTGSEDKEPNDGSDKQGHGSHVASTAAGDTLNLTLGNGQTTRISGVAPSANIISYKACEEEAKCRGTWLIAAINQAVADKVDVINYSIGGGNLNPWQYQDSMAMLAAFEAGIVVVVSAGNEGPMPGTVTSPGNAPWVITAANTTHDRGDLATLTLGGGPTPRPGNGVLKGQSLTKTPYGPATIVYGGDHGSALCATGTNVNALPPSTSTSPWSGKPFSGEIVVCDRGIYARVIKGLNVKNAGGGGMVLVNDRSSGSSLVADEHELPATHLTFVDGAELKDWLSHGSGHTATISASSRQYLPMFADQLASSSSRGPIDGDWLKPNVAAPGTNILAAYKEENGETSLFAYMSGTSMASPHVAGGVLLLRQAHPDWTPAEVISALQTTARPSVRLADEDRPATVLEAGAGVVDLSKAAKPGLVFPVTGAQFRAANPSPALGGKPRDLNLPSLVDGKCLASCSFTRTVRNVGEQGSWQASVVMAGGQLTVTPSSFTLAKNATRELKFTYTPDATTRYGYWQDGEVVLTRAGTNSTRIPVTIRSSAGELPDVLTVSGNGTVASEAGWAEVGLAGLVALPSARFAGTDLVEPIVASATIAQDPTADKVYDGLSSAQFGKSIFHLRADRDGRARLRVEAYSTTATDIDLYVGRASSDTELPLEATEICSSTTPTATERCDLELDVAAGEYFWVLVQNWQSSAAGKDTVKVEAGLVPLDASEQPPAQRPLIAAGPGKVGLREAFKLRLAWNDPSMAPGEHRWGHLLIGADAANPDGIGRVLVKMNRAQNVTNAAAALVPGETRNMRLLAGQAQDRLYVDVPPNTSQLKVTSRGSSKVRLYLAHAANPTWPAIAVAPDRSAAAASSSGDSSIQEVSISGATLKPGRWYVTPVNTGSSRVNFKLDVSLTQTSNRPQPGWGNWYQPARDGSGFFLSPALDGSVWVLTWYTYLEDGSPTWYLGTAAAPTSKQGSVSFPMSRFSWDGQATHEVGVGTATLALGSSNTMQVNWNMEGESGSQQLLRIETPTCQNLGNTGKKPDGNWFNPNRSGYGFEALSFPGTEAYIAYIYDAQGRARWVMAAQGGNASVGASAQFEAGLHWGSCPLCSYVSPDIEPVGSISRRFASASQAKLGVTVAYPAPLSGQWQTSDDMELLTTPVSCQ